jgi:D-cysteine desulfhydrase
LDVLAHRAGVSELWIKRDDLTHPVHGGNKVRKLEWILGAAIRDQTKTLVTGGALGSNHVLATAVFGRALGMNVEAYAVPRPMTDAVRQAVRATEDTGAIVHRLPSATAYPLVIAGDLIRRRILTRDGARFIPIGGSSPVGMLGYVNAAFELKAQIAAGLCSEPRAIFVPAGSGGTVSGLLAGCRLAGLGCQVVGVRIVPRLALGRFRVLRRARAVLRLIRRAGWTQPMPSIGLGDVTVLGGHEGPGYGAPSRESRLAVALTRDLEQVDLDPDYAAKAMAGMLAELVRWPALRRAPILFWLTSPARAPTVL